MENKRFLPFFAKQASTEWVLVDSENFDKDNDSNPTPPR
ncbi:hypothetical protein T4A_10901 [Trichinella pseudospiralis]|uniref:Uncharacterized protein n=1 Tax=Trichinella pseudospiralis TaxID=6337 RepID=A0A0V1E2R6_TRIPS|nr:hypothetical protein T4A_10901 [Trichinella pseudospiralis]